METLIARESRIARETQIARKTHCDRHRLQQALGRFGNGWRALMSPGADLGVGKDLLRISSNLPQPLLFSQRQLGGRLIFVIVC